MAGVGLAYGLEYYLTPIQERAFSARHELLKPSGLIGQGYGVIGTLCMLVGVPMYSLRKRARILARAGKLKVWLQTHIFLCTLGPFLILLHTGFKIGGVVSIAFWSMVRYRDRHEIRSAVSPLGVRHAPGKTVLESGCPAE